MNYGRKLRRGGKCKDEEQGARTGICLNFAGNLGANLNKAVTSLRMDSKRYMAKQNNFHAALF